MERKFKSLLSHLLKVGSMTGTDLIDIKLNDKDYYTNKRIFDYILKKDNDKYQLYEEYDGKYILKYGRLIVIFIKII